MEDQKYLEKKIELFTMEILNEIESSIKELAIQTIADISKHTRSKYEFDIDGVLYVKTRREDERLLNKMLENEAKDLIIKKIKDIKVEF